MSIGAKVLAVMAALAIVPGGAYLAAANIGTGGLVAIAAAVGWWVLASSLIGRFALKRRPELRTPVRSALVLASVASIAVVFLATRDKEVDEEIATGVPVAEAQEPAPRGARGGGEPEPREPREREPQRRNVQVLAGSFEGASGHSGTGKAAVVDLAEGGRVLTFSDFDVERGAGSVRVYLTAGEPQSDGEVTDFEDIGGLKGNVGDQQYEIPRGIDLERYSTVVIWCTPFTTRLAQAPLS